MKTAATYTNTLGQLVGIVGPDDTTNLATSKPTLTATSQGSGLIEIKFDKSTSEGVNIYCMRGGEALSTFLARDTASPYVDTRPLLVPGKPEVREYKAKYVVADEEIGEFSDEAVITAVP